MFFKRKKLVIQENCRKYQMLIVTFRKQTVGNALFGIFTLKNELARTKDFPVWLNAARLTAQNHWSLHSM